jgi:hypothetical protein
MQVNDQLLLSFKKNQRINLKERYADGWCYGECNGWYTRTHACTTRRDTRGTMPKKTIFY